MLRVKDSPYEYNVAILKRYNKNTYKLTVHKVIRKKGVEMPVKHKKNSVNTSKLENNISRAKTKIYEYAMCNDFDYFVTLTLDPKKIDRYDLNSYIKKLGKFLNNYNTNHNTKVQYVLIPEMHKDGAWHMHGLIKGILSKHLIKNDNGFLNWEHYSSRFGYISLSKIKNTSACAKYITKYINKDIDNTVKELGARTYYCSKGLKKAVEIKRGTLAKEFQFQFENEYIKTSAFKIDDDITLNTFLNTIV